MVKGESVGIHRSKQRQYSERHACGTDISSSLIHRHGMIAKSLDDRLCVFATILRCG